MTDYLRHAVFENANVTEFRNIPEGAIQPSREGCQLAALSEH